MADKKNTQSDEVFKDVPTEYPEDGGNQAFLDQQNAAYLHYKATGVNDQGWIDTTRDQEPDVAPEFGVAPHPELFNPAPPSTSFSGKALDPGKVPMVKDVEQKEEDGKEATEAYNEYLQKREELFEATKDTVVAAPAQPVFLVDKPDAGVEAPDLVASDSLKNSANATGADAQLPNASGFGTDPSGPDTKSDKAESDKK